MTITKYDRVAVLPKRCDKCNRLFWLEPYNIFYQIAGIDGPLNFIECKNCMDKVEKKEGNKEGYIDEHGHYHLSHDMYERLKMGEPVPPISPKRY